MKKNQNKVTPEILALANNQPEHFVCDSRALSFIMNDSELDLTNHEDWGKFIILAGETAHSACEACNEGTYGALCIPVDSEGSIMWSWYRGDWKWEPDIKELPDEDEFSRRMMLLIDEYSAYIDKIH